MKRNAISSVVAGLAFALAAAPVAAQQTQGQGPLAGRGYGSAQLGISDVDGFDNGLVLVLNGGMGLTPERRGGFSVEGEITTTISEPEIKVSNGSADLSYYTIAGYGVYTIPATQNFDVRARLGLLYENLDVNTSGQLSGVSIDDGDDFSPSFGVGASYRITKTLSGIAEYTYIEQDINHFSAGVQIRF
jgi:hypothetical protein